MENRYTAAVITVSDKGFAGLREDTSGPTLVKLLREDGYEVISTSLVPDDMEKIMTELTICADRLSPCLIVTTGGTGFSEYSDSNRSFLFGDCVGTGRSDSGCARSIRFCRKSCAGTCDRFYSESGRGSS